MGCVLGCSRDQDVISATQKTHKLESSHCQSHPRTTPKKSKGPPPQKKAAGKKKKKKKQRQFDGPRKGRKESFTKYIPGYVPTVEVEDPELFGVFDAAEYVDPYTVAREELQHPRKPTISSEQAPTKSAIIGTPNRTCTQTRPSPTQPYQERSCTSSSQTNSHYYSDNLYLYESEHHHHGQNNGHSPGDYPCHNEDSVFNVGARYDAGANDNAGGYEAGNTGSGCD